MRTETTVTVYGTLHGAFWWPIGEPWEKHVRETRVHRPAADSYTYRSETPDLRSLILEITNDGDSSEGCRLSADSVIVVSRRRGAREHKRTFPVTMFPSIVDCVVAE